MSTPAVQGASSTISTVTPPLPDSPFKILPRELTSRIIFFTNNDDKENTRFICHEWHDITLYLTVKASKEANQADVENLVHLLHENLDPKKHLAVRVELQEIDKIFRSFNRVVTTHTQANHLFLMFKGFVHGVFCDLPPDQNEPLFRAIDLQIPPSYQHIFWTFDYPEPSVELFYIQLYSCLRSVPPEITCAPRMEILKCAMKEKSNFFRWNRSSFFVEAVKHSDLDGLRLLMEDWFDSVDEQNYAVGCAVRCEDVRVLQLFLEKGLIKDEYRSWAIEQAVKSNNLENLRLLLQSGPTSEFLRGMVFYQAAQLNNVEAIRLLLANGEIPTFHRDMSVLAATKSGNLELVEFLINRVPGDTVFAILLLLVNRSISWETRKKVVKFLLPYINWKAWLFWTLYVVFVYVVSLIWNRQKSRSQAAL